LDGNWTATVWMRPTFGEDALLAIVEGHTREAGVRGLERQLKVGSAYHAPKPVRGGHRPASALSWDDRIYLEVDRRFI
jgi:hypothetical protein